MKKFWFAFLLMLSMSYTAYCQNCDNCQNCDKKLTPVNNPKIQYKEREKRCEGFYSSPVSAKSIDVVGLIKGEFRFKLDKDEKIKVDSPFIRKKPINVRAVGIPIKTYYRMDASISPDQTLIWPVGDVIFIQQLSDYKIGIYGWIGQQNVPDKYVPVVTRAEKGKERPSDNKVRLYMRTSVDVDSVKWRIADVVKGDCSFKEDWKNAPNSSYRSDLAFPIELPDKNELCVEVGAKPKNDPNWLKKSVRVLLKD